MLLSPQVTKQQGLLHDMKVDMAVLKFNMASFEVRPHEPRSAHKSPPKPMIATPCVSMLIPQDL